MVAKSRENVANSSANTGKSRENVGKHREDDINTKNPVGKSKEGLGVSKSNFGKSREDIIKSRENVGQSKENFGKSKDNLGKPKDSGGEQTEIAKPEVQTLPNPNFFWGEDVFNLDNGDIYDGEYCCHKSGIIWREGNGVYATKDGHFYSGLWENDQLKNSPDSQVIFPTADEYIGSIISGKYSGAGTYIFNNKLILQSIFENNRPIGEITLIDYEGHLWKGPAEAEKPILLSVNHFFDSIPPDRGLGRIPKPKSKKISLSEKSGSSEIKEETVFAKSTKTNNDFSFDEVVLAPSFHYVPSAISMSWRSVVTTLLKSEESQKKPSEISITLLKTFLSRSYRTKSVGIPVFTPTCDMEQTIEEGHETVEGA